MSTPSTEETYRRVFRALMVGRAFPFPASVLAWDPSTRSVTIQSDFKVKFKGEEAQERPPIERVPVLFPGANGWGVSLPDLVGSKGLAIGCARSLDRWKETRAPVDPSDPRILDPTDVVFLPGLDQMFDTQGVDASDMVIGKLDGTASILIKPDGSIVLSGEAGADFVALAGKVDALMTKIGLYQAQVATWATAVGVLPVVNVPFPTVQTPLAPTSVAASKVKAK